MLMFLQQHYCCFYVAAVCFAWKAGDCYAMTRKLQSLLELPCGCCSCAAIACSLSVLLLLQLQLHSLLTSDYLLLPSAWTTAAPQQAPASAAAPASPHSSRPASTSVSASAQSRLLLLENVLPSTVPVSEL
jgi:hypothetical protein